ncbi:MAG TPA: hypothetical protein ACFCUC_09860 [Desulfobacterales bacterium]
MDAQNSHFERVLKVPSLLVLMMAGFVLEFLIELPFAVMCLIERRFGRRSM